MWELCQQHEAALLQKPDLVEMVCRRAADLAAPSARLDSQETDDRKLSSRLPILLVNPAEYILELNGRDLKRVLFGKNIFCRCQESGLLLKPKKIQETRPTLSSLGLEVRT